MELSDIDISQISVPEGIRLKRISFHQVENKKKKNTKDKKKKHQRLIGHFSEFFSGSLPKANCSTKKRFFWRSRRY